MSVRFAISFDNRDAACAAADTLGGMGFQVEVQPGVVVAWSHQAHGVDVAEASTLMRRVAREYGGDFMGHGGISSCGLNE